MGHEVEFLSSTPLCLSRFTRHVRRANLVPRFGSEPNAWFDAANTICQIRPIDVLFPTHEQVTVLPARQSELRAATIVPPLASLKRVQDKVSAYECLRAIGMPQPQSVVVEGPQELRLVQHPINSFLIRGL
jgi:glutathione synthase/RimK-type ligase-like ATP-grasp enzyme